MMKDKKSIAPRNLLSGKSAGKLVTFKYREPVHTEHLYLIPGFSEKSDSVVQKIVLFVDQHNQCGSKTRKKKKK